VFSEKFGVKIVVLYIQANIIELGLATFSLCVHQCRERVNHSWFPQQEVREWKWNKYI